MMRWLRLVGVVSAFALIASACGLFGGDEETSTNPVEDEAAETEDTSGVSVADARLTVRADADPVVVNGDELESGSFQEATAGDVIQAAAPGTAVLTAESVFEIEAFRGGTVTVPELTGSPLDVKLEVGHVFVTLNADANTVISIDAGERQFITRSPDAEFALCQAPDGASCLAVLRGEVEWFEDGVASEVYSAGRASFAARGNVPEPPRCADQLAIGEMQRSLRGEDFTGTLANIVDTWEPCEEGDGLEAIGPAVPSAARFERVVVDEIVIGSPDVDEDTENVIAERELDGSADFYIEPLTATNGEFRSWLVNTAGDDADLWRQYAPQEWIDRAPGGAVTQAIYAPDTADDAVQGVAYDTAVAYCTSQAKRLPTEIEWELAATTETLRDLADEAQDWVTNWEDYGPGPAETEGRQVLRGADGVLTADPYFRVFAVTEAEATAARQRARVRCAADEVAIGGQVFENPVVEDDFNSIDWPIVTEELFELDYHPENYHIDIKDRHTRGAIVRQLPEPLSEGRVDIDLFIERNNTGPDTGAFRFGALFGTVDNLQLITIQPDSFTRDSFLACVMPLGPDLEAELDLANTLSPDSEGVYGSVHPTEGHYGEDCVDAETSVEVTVPDIDNAVQLSIVLTGGATEMWVNDTLVQESDAFSSFDVYGFYSQLFHRERSHIHYDNLTITVP